MINKAIIVGNLGAKPELRSTNSGSHVSSLRIATSERRKDSSGTASVCRRATSNPEMGR
jgi:single-strand DNA-binding protein